MPVIFQNVDISTGQMSRHCQPDSLTEKQDDGRHVLRPSPPGFRVQAAIDEGDFRSDRSIYRGAADMHLILPTAREVASALTYLHSKNVLHGAISNPQPNLTF